MSTGRRRSLSSNPLIQACAYGTVSDVMRCLTNDKHASDLVNATDDKDGWTPLMLAATRGSKKMCRILIKAGASIDAVLTTDSVNDTALHMAAKNGHLEAIEELLLAGAEVNFTIKGKPTPLICAAGNGQAPAVQRLLKAGADPNILCSDGWSALLLASLGRGPGGRHLECMKALINAGAALEATDTRDGRTALIVATMEGHKDIVDLLLSNGAALYPQLHQNEDWTNPVMLAAIKGHIDILKCLIKAGADIQIANKTNSTAVTYAAVNGQTEALKILLDTGALPDPKNTDGGATPLILITYSPLGNIPCIKLLLKHGADVHAVDNKGRTALVHAATIGKKEVMEVLLDAGAEPNVMVNLGDCLTTADFLATDSKRRSLVAAVAAIHTKGSNAAALVELLLKAGGDANLSEPHGATALHSCASKDNIEAAKVLLKYGAVLNKGGYGYNEVPLMVAASKGNDKIIQLFLQNGADPNAQDTEGWTSLMHAALQGKTSAVQLLIQAGGDYNASSNTGRTALASACRKGHVAVVQALLQAGADVNLRRGDGMTPLMIAAEQGHRAVVSTLIQAGADLELTRSITVSNSIINTAGGSGGGDGNKNEGGKSTKNKKNSGSITSGTGTGTDVTTDHVVTAAYLAQIKGHDEIVEALEFAKTHPRTSIIKKKPLKKVEAAVPSESVAKGKGPSSSSSGGVSPSPSAGKTAAAVDSTNAGATAASGKGGNNKAYNNNNKNGGKNDNPSSPPPPSLSTGKTPLEVIEKVAAKYNRLGKENPLAHLNELLSSFCASCGKDADHQSMEGKDMMRCPNCNCMCYCSEECRKRDEERHVLGCDMMSLYAHKSSL